MGDEISRPQAEAIERVVQYNSCDLSDVMNRAQTMVGITAVYRPIEQIVGPAITVSAVVPSVGMVKVGLDCSQPGDVLVISAPASEGHAVWGGNLAAVAKARGLLGVIVDGAVRDADEIRSIGFPTFSRHIATAAAPAYVPHGEINVPIACGGVVVVPGDLIVGDQDGIVVLPHSDLDVILDEAESSRSRNLSSRHDARAGLLTGLERVKEQFRADGFELPGEDFTDDSPTNR